MWLLTSGKTRDNSVQSPYQDEPRRSGGPTIGCGISDIHSSLAVACLCFVPSGGTCSCVTPPVLPLQPQQLWMIPSSNTAVLSLVSPTKSYTSMRCSTDARQRQCSRP